jgi:hypothetical protein
MACHNLSVRYHICMLNTKQLDSLPRALETAREALRIWQSILPPGHKNISAAEKQARFNVTRHTSHVTRHKSQVTSHTSHFTRHTSHITHHTSPLTHHASHVTRHTSHVTRHTSHVILHTSHITRHTSHVTCHSSCLRSASCLLWMVRETCFWRLRHLPPPPSPISSSPLPASP